MMRSMLLVWRVAVIVLAFTASISWSENPSSQTPYFRVIGTSDKIERLPLEMTSIDANITGVVADVHVTQTYTNRGDKTIEAVYVFPASTRAAVYAVTMTIGDRVIKAQIQEKSAAKATYDKAKSEGRTASLLQQDDPGVFKMNLANILPGDKIRVEMRYTELLVPTEGVYEFFFPNTFTERYVPAGAHDIATPTSADPEVTDYSFNFKAHVLAGTPIEGIESPSHELVIDRRNPRDVGIQMAESEVHGSRKDLVLRFRLSGGEIETGMILSPGPSENYFLLMAQPPKLVMPEQVVPREFIFVVDVSGSMHGEPLALALSLMQDLLKVLRPVDRFNIIMFSGGSAVMSSVGSLYVNADSSAQADKFMHSGYGGGGTELLPALEQAYALPRAGGMSRSIVVVTDGEIPYGGEEYKLVRKHLSEANVFSFGVGSGVNRPVMENLARAGMGEPFIVQDMTQGPEVAGRLRKYIDRPALSNVTVGFEGFDAYDVEPQFVPDLLAERPLVIVGKYRGAATGSVVIGGTTGKEKRAIRMEAAAALVDARSSALPYLWARTRIARLLDERMESYYHRAPAGDDAQAKDILALGLKYSLLTPYTSFVAVSDEVRTNEAGETVQQPAPARMQAQAVASGWGSPASFASRLNVDIKTRIAPEMITAAERISEVAGHRFAKIGDDWVDQASTPTKTTLRVRVGSNAFARLLALDPRFAQWAKLGTVVRIKFGACVIELSPKGFSDYSKDVLRRAIGHG